MNLYFDNQMATSISQATLDAMVTALSQRSISLEMAYKTMYALVEAKESDHFVFTSSGCEAINQAVFSTYLNVTRQQGKNHFITSNIEESPSILSMSRLQQLGCVFEMAPANKEGYVSVDAIAETMTPRTAMVSLSWANGLTGVVQPVEEIAKLCSDRGVLFHVDATHVLGKGYYTLKSSGADFLTFNGEQMHAPKGTGGLFVRSEIEIAPLIIGDKSLRGGGLNHSTLIGLQETAEELLQDADHVGMELCRLRDRFEKQLLAQIPKCHLLFGDQQRVPHIAAFLFQGVTSDALLYLLERRGMHASFGGGQFQDLRNILEACGVPKPDCHCGLSFAFSRDTKEEQIDRGVKIIVQTVLQLQKYSQFMVGN